tara:strand:+ start:167 stop:478 length:312 start_codon:yes stop_codon:yes gene_type:complete
MLKIYVKDRSGKEHKINADTNLTLMEILRDEGFEIEAACGGCCACATCHVYIDKNWIKKLDIIGEDEESMLDQAFDVKENSRLGCQIEFTEELDGIKLEIAPD